MQYSQARLSFGNTSWEHVVAPRQPGLAAPSPEPNPASPLAAFTNIPWLWSQFKNDHYFNPTLKTISTLTTVGTPRRRDKVAQTTPAPPFTSHQLSPRLPSRTKAARGGEKGGGPPPSRKLPARLEDGLWGQRAPPGSRLPPPHSDPPPP